MKDARPDPWFVVDLERSFCRVKAERRYGSEHQRSCRVLFRLSTFAASVSVFAIGCALL